MITVEIQGDKCLIRFSGKKQQFNEYINKVMTLPGKDWSLEDKCWTIPNSSLYYLEEIFKNIQYLDDVKKKSTVSDFDCMGKSMKLSPYDYQKEAIKFGLDARNILIVYPCGSGRECI